MMEFRLKFRKPSVGGHDYFFAIQQRRFKRLPFWKDIGFDGFSEEDVQVGRNAAEYAVERTKPRLYRWLVTQVPYPIPVEPV